jgi:hypothetical protein
MVKKFSLFNHFLFITHKSNLQHPTSNLEHYNAKSTTTICPLAMTTVLWSLSANDKLHLEQ